MAHILVTGGAGFIGTHVVERLLRDGHRASILDCFDDHYDPAVKHAQIADALALPSCRLYQGDVRDIKALQTAFKREAVDVVVHLAGRVGGSASCDKAVLYTDANVVGTAKLLEAVVKYGCSKFILASSASVYGASATVPFGEDALGDWPVSPLGSTKRCAEMLCHNYHLLHGLNVTSLRFFSVYGPRCRPDLTVARFTRLIDDGQPVSLDGDGSMKRDMVFIDDAVDGIVAAIDRCDGAHVYNVGSSQGVTVREQVQTIARRLGKEAVVQSREIPLCKLPTVVADISRARAELGYEPQVSFEDGVGRYVEWYQSMLVDAGAAGPG